MNIFSRNTKSNFSEAEELGKEGITNYLQKDYNSAVKYLTKAIDISPQNITFLKYRGNAYEDLKEYRHAINDYLKINKIEEHHTNYHSIGFCYMQLNERQPAVDAYDNALRLKINNSNEKGLTKIKDGIPVCISTEVLYNNRAAARLKLQDFEGALSDVEKALQINPSYSKAEETKILIETAQGYSILTQNGNLGNNSSGNNKMEFKRRIISHANSSANALPNGLRLRDVIFLNYAE
jgi:tetratricopeptide (TPR) repeat protein